MRSPIHWLDDIQTPTYILEGESGNPIDKLCAATRNPQVHCLTAQGHDHFSILAPATRLIAAKLIASHGGRPFSLPDLHDLGP